MLLVLLSRHVTYQENLEPAHNEEPSPYEHYFTQLVDHFSPLNTSTWQQRYYLNDGFYNKKSKLAIIHIGGEGELFDTSVTGKYSGYYFAQNMNALLIGLEHRFYGKSTPEKTMDDLEYLTAEQAIGDFAEFIPYIKQQYGVEKVMVMGGSYPGFLAAELRAKLPHLVDAALASSGPLNAKFNYFEYLEHVQQELDDDVRSKLSPAYEELQYQLYKNDPQLWKNICNVLRIPQALCDFTDDNDKLQVLELMTDAVAGIVQYAKPALYDGQLEIGEIEEFSEYIKDCPATDHVCVWDVINTFKGCAGCDYEKYDDMIAAMQVSSTDAGRNWYAETCIEFAFYQTTAFDYSVFPSKIDMNYFTDICHHAFYVPLNISSDIQTSRKLVEEFTEISNFERYGGLNVPRDHIWYTSGAVDPWTELAMENLGWDKGQFRPKDTVFKLISWGSHCSDLYLAWTINDEIRAEQLAQFKQWLGIE